MNLAEVTHPDHRVERASRRYARTLLTGTNPHRGDGDIREQVQRYQEARVRLATMEQQVRQLLNDRDVPYWFCIHYVNFARRVNRVMSRFESKTRWYMVQEAVARWQAYGCDTEILEEICRVVLDLDPDEQTTEGTAGRIPPGNPVAGPGLDSTGKEENR